MHGGIYSWSKTVRVRLLLRVVGTVLRYYFERALLGRRNVSFLHLFCEKMNGCLLWEARESSFVTAMLVLARFFVGFGDFRVIEGVIHRVRITQGNLSSSFEAVEMTWFSTPLTKISSRNTLEN